MSQSPTAECCPRFDPKPWDEVTLDLRGRRFVKERVSSFLHIPLNYGAVMKRTIGAIEAAGARPETMVVLTDENSLWGADVYVEAGKDVPGASTGRITSPSWQRSGRSGRASPRTCSGKQGVQGCLQVLQAVGLLQERAETVLAEGGGHVVVRVAA